MSPDKPLPDFSDVQGGSSSKAADPGTANRATIKNPDLIHPGQVLNLPDLP